MRDQYSSVASRLLLDPEIVVPCNRRLRRLGKCDFQRNFRVSPCCEAPELRYTTLVLDGFLKAAIVGSGDVAKEPEHVKQVGLAGGICTDNELTLAQPNFDASEVPLVLHRKLCDYHGISMGDEVM